MRETSCAHLPLSPGPARLLKSLTLLAADGGSMGACSGGKVDARVDPVGHDSPCARFTLCVLLFPVSLPMSRADGGGIRGSVGARVDPVRCDSCCVPRFVRSAGWGGIAGGDASSVMRVSVCACVMRVSVCACMPRFCRLAGCGCIAGGDADLFASTSARAS